MPNIPTLLILAGLLLPLAAAFCLELPGGPARGEHRLFGLCWTPRDGVLGGRLATAGLTLYALRMILHDSTVNHADNLVPYGLWMGFVALLFNLAVALLLLKICFYTRWSWGQLAVLLLLLGPELLGVWRQPNETQLLGLLAIAAAKDVDLHRVLRLIFRVLVLGLAVLALLSLAGLIPMDREDYLERGMLAMGLMHPNNGAEYVLAAGSCYLLLTGLRGWRWLVPVALTVYIQLTSQARSSQLGLLTMTAALLLLKLLGDRLRKKPWGAVLAAVPVGMTVLSLLPYWIFSPQAAWWKWLDRFGTGRMWLFHAGLARNPVTLLGRPVQYDEQFFTLDNTYLSVLLYNGVAGLAAFVLALGLLFYVFWKHGCRSETAVLLGVCTQGLLENRADQPLVNLCLLLLLPALLSLTGRPFRGFAAPAEPPKPDDL